MKTPQAKSARQVVSIALTARAQQLVGKAKLETGVTQLALLERLLEWYSCQDPRVRTMILSPYAQVRSGLAKLLLEEMKSHPQKDLDALPKFSGLIDHDFDSDVMTSTNVASSPSSGKRRSRRRASEHKPSARDVN